MGSSPPSLFTRIQAPRNSWKWNLDFRTPAKRSDGRPMQQVLQSIGATLYPLTTANDAADLMEAAARVPIATPRRSMRIVQFLSSSLHNARATAYELAEFFSRSEQEGPLRFEEVAALIPPGDGQILVTDRTTCIVCDGPLEEATNDHGKHYSASPKLFTQDGVVSSTLLWLRCSKCKCKHYLSYAVGGDLLPEGTARVYPGWAAAKYTHVTDETVFETRTLLRWGGGGKQPCSSIGLLLGPLSKPRHSDCGTIVTTPVVGKGGVATLRSGSTVHEP